MNEISQTGPSEDVKGPTRRDVLGGLAALPFALRNVVNGTADAILQQAQQAEVDMPTALTFEDFDTIFSDLDRLEYTPMEGMSSPSFNFSSYVPGEETARGAEVNIVDPTGVVSIVNPLALDLGEDGWDTQVARRATVRAEMTSPEQVEAHWNSDKVVYDLIASENDSRAVWLTAAEEVVVAININPSRKVLIMGSTEGVRTGGAVFGPNTMLYLVDNIGTDNEVMISGGIAGVPAVLQVAEFSLPAVVDGNERLIFNVESVTVQMKAYPGGAATHATFGGATSFRLDQTTYPGDGLDMGVKLSGNDVTFFGGTALGEQ